MVIVHGLLIDRNGSKWLESALIPAYLLIVGLTLPGRLVSFSKVEPAPVKLR